MHIEFLVEGLSDEVVLLNVVPKIVGQAVSFDIHPFDGKPDLLSKLEGRLKGYSHWLPDDWRIVVLIDEDREDCIELKRKLESCAEHAGLQTRSGSILGQPYVVLNRLAIEELEAWFFGDIPALKQAYARIPASLNQKAGFRNPDSIPYGTWEALEKVMKNNGYFRTGMNKIEAARSISVYMEPGRNKSHSFMVFREGLIDLTN